MEHVRQFRIVSRVQETAEAATLTLQPVDGKPFEYAPGQYLSLVFNTLSGEQRRAYSFSSCPGVDALPAVTVKRVVNGAFSGKLVSESLEGDILTAAGPSGLFTLPSRLPATLLYVCAGSGITPVMSHLKYLLETPQKRRPRIVLYYANRNVSGTLFKQELDALAAKHPDVFEVQYVYSREDHGVPGLHGRLNNAWFETLLKQHVGIKKLRKAHVYLCAPVALTRMAAMTLRLLDVPDENLHREVFVPDSRMRLREVDTSKKHTVRIEDPEKPVVFETYEGETILNAALRQDIALPYTCKSGVCFTCLARCQKGDVDVAFVESVKREGPGAMVNTCIGYAVSEEVVLAFE